MTNSKKIYNFFNKLTNEKIKIISFIIFLINAYSQYQNKRKIRISGYLDIFDMVDCLIEGAIVGVISFVCIFIAKKLIMNIISLNIKIQLKQSIPSKKLRKIVKEYIIEENQFASITGFEEVMLECDKQYEYLLEQEKNIKDIIIEGIKSIDTSSSTHFRKIKEESLKYIYNDLTIDELYNMLSSIIRHSKIYYSDKVGDEHYIYAKKQFNKLIYSLSQINPALDLKFYHSEREKLLEQVNYGQQIINTFMKELIIKQKGHIGEERVNRDLKLYDDYINYLSNIRFEVDGTSVETDGIIVCDKGIFALEIKNYGKKGDTINITKDGNVSITDVNGRLRKVDVIQQHNRHCALKQKVINKELRELNLVNEYIIINPVIVIANDDIRIENESNIKVVRSSSIIHEVLNIKENILSKDIQKEIMNIINKHKLPLKKYSVINVENSIRSVVSNIVSGSNYLCELNSVNEEVINELNRNSLISVRYFESNILEDHLLSKDMDIFINYLLDLK